MSRSSSRRQFLRYGTGAAAAALTPGCGAPRPAGVASLRSASLNGAVTATTPSPSAMVVKATPSLYFTSREAGSQEMNWGPVKDYTATVPNGRFYVHNRTRPPSIDRQSWRLEIAGSAITRPRSLTYAELQAMPQVTLRRVLDCGANCRAFFPPLPPRAAGWLPIGFTQWHFGAMGVADWTGIPLRDLLEAAGLEGAVDVMFTGLDEIPTGNTTARYGQVVSVDKALAADTILVLRMNGEELPVDHGWPLRVLFSGWGGNTAVKWLGRIEAAKQKIPHPLFQARQVIAGPDVPRTFTPTTGHVRSAMELDADTTLAPGDIVLRGRAWSGAGAIDRVDISVEKLVAPGTFRPLWSPAWRQARLLGRPEPFVWARFELAWPGATPGRYRVMTRARDAAGNVQPAPEAVVWNQQGLGYNGHAPLELAVMPPATMP
ncbi:MAG: molybdopterin-dependent oxidoreductase [Labilithrix sp.]|nr:molybdopterin-dependent oxidoreductase [Labilithrix sp.]